VKHPKLTYGLGIAAVLAGAGALAVHHDLAAAFHGYRFSEEEVVVLEKRLEEVEARKREIERQVKELNEDSLELEAAIRADQGHVRDGETVYNIAWPPAADTAGTTEVH
jgi:cell division protein FtsB